MRSNALILMFIFLPTALVATGASSQTAENGGRKLQTVLTGEAEVTAAGVPNQGDLDGTGTATVTVNPGQRRICYSIEVAGIAPAAAAHIHEAAPTTTGPIVVPLAAPSDGDSSACVSVTRQLALEILKDPADYYINVHNADFPAGALRGQLAK
jgi:hypothetical protein